MTQKATVIVNPIAGPGRTATIGACVDLVKSIFAGHQCDADVRITTGPNDANRFATEAVAGRVDVVAAWGGDGTVNGAAAGVAGSGIPLAIIPGGSGNGLARDLSIPFDAVQALTIAATGKTRAIDAGDLNGSLFFNVAGVGLDARIAGRLASGMPLPATPAAAPFTVPSPPHAAYMRARPALLKMCDAIIAASRPSNSTAA